MSSVLSWEILAYIFRLSQLSNTTIDDGNLRLGDYDVPSMESGIPPEIQVSHVSQRWRQIALGTGALWTTIFVQPGASHEAVSAYLERSSGSLLDVIIVCDGPPYDDDERSRAHQKTFDLALLHISRWRRCWFDSPRDDIDSPFLPCLTPVHAPALEYLSIGVESSNRLRPPQRGGLSIESTPGMFKGGCPRLRFVYLRGVAVWFFCPPMSTVIALSIEHTRQIRISLPEFRALLKSSPSLTHFSISGDILGDQSWPQSESITMPALRSLAISSFRASNYSSILLAIDAPRLRKIVLKDAQEHDLDPFLHSSHAFKFPLLRSLVFCDSHFTVLKYRMFFASFPSVSELTLYGDINLPSILRIISDTAHFAPHSVDSLWPRLKVLNVDLSLATEEGLLPKDGLERRLKTGHGPKKMRLGIPVDEEEDYALVMACSDPDWLEEHISVEIMEGAVLWRQCCC
ncbi:hypothetical protein PQX77_003193 [Marasmius sp. AFHP31]|nr:hypothetical protein PQX77_004228 [Marasmius sp. AFHP31]KAK1233649.1 hypothetical protein PQX77_003193 [Marasmius sp. AFHP31]